MEILLCLKRKIYFPQTHERLMGPVVTTQCKHVLRLSSACFYQFFFIKVNYEHWKMPEYHVLHIKIILLKQNFTKREGDPLKTYLTGTPRKDAMMKRKFRT